MMGAGSTWRKAGGALLVSVAFLCAGNLASAASSQQQNQRPQKKTTKKAPPQLAPLPSGPTGPVQQIPLDSIAAVPPQVSFQNNQLTIVAPNSTLADILRAVRKQTGAEIEVPAAPERVVTHLGPGPARDVVAELLNGSRFNYVLLGSPTDDAQLTKVVLVAKSGVETAAATPPAPVSPQANNAPPPADQPIEAVNEAEQNDDANNTDDAADQAAADAEQQQQQQLQFGQPNPDQPAIKTPQQMLQEMQQRQMQMQQQQVPGQPPIPGPGVPQRAPQEQ